MSGSPALTLSQKDRSLSTRRSGGFPAIIAALTAPIDMPATQSTLMPLRSSS
jgi:hypothetical protein